MRLMWTKVVSRTKEQICKLLFLSNDHFWTNEEPEPSSVSQRPRKQSRNPRALAVQRTISSQHLLGENPQECGAQSLKNDIRSVASRNPNRAEGSSAYDDSYVVRIKNYRKSKNTERLRSCSRQHVTTCRSRTFSHREMLQKSRKCVQSPFCLAAYHQQWEDFELFMDIGTDVNQEQTCILDGSNSQIVCLRFASVIDLLLHSIRNKSISARGLRNGLNMNNQNRCTVFPQLLSSLLNKGADVRVNTLRENDHSGGIHVARLTELFQLAGFQFAKAFSSEPRILDGDFQVDAAGIIRQLLQSGLDIPLCEKHLPHCSTTLNFIQILYFILLEGLTHRLCNPKLGRLSASLQSFVILWLNLVYSSSACDYQCYSALSRGMRNKSMLAFHRVFQQLYQPPRLFILARRTVRQLIGTRWFWTTVTDSGGLNSTNGNTRDFYCLQRSQAISDWLSPLSETLRRSIAYLEAQDIRQDLQSIRVCGGLDVNCEQSDNEQIANCES
ncbi:hypothetical protein FBUS_07239 [Fasciolopsis buskii]|uniref:Uncharacterized protein n=1 Tax=Fasciolopsis buskii TaxID=27845 RepID=A0A8E0S680_9TREM|nr:hypothetical protein FBUS_07239 [Fasciolopsis buski]